MTDDLAPAEVTYLRAAIDLARRSRIGPALEGEARSVYVGFWT